jgi:hypothetical protein
VRRGEVIQQQGASLPRVGSVGAARDIDVHDAPGLLECLLEGDVAVVPIENSARPRWSTSPNHDVDLADFADFAES